MVDHAATLRYIPLRIKRQRRQKLIDMGAVMVGKTKTSQFAHGADPWEFVDIHYPFNPCGDGWLSAASSSAGSAIAIAGYDWIDIALGSDTRGSVRKPATCVGSSGIRPTWNSMNLTGVIPPLRSSIQPACLPEIRACFTGLPVCGTKIRFKLP